MTRPHSSPNQIQWVHERGVEMGCGTRQGAVGCKSRVQGLHAVHMGCMGMGCPLPAVHGLPAALLPADALLPAATLLSAG